ncbi:MAG: TRAP transporter small permease subunit [Sneathiellaceae bacterium]
MILRRVDLVLGIVASLILAGIALLTFTDVVFRNAGEVIRGTVEVTELMMGALIFTALPLVGFRDGHVTVELTEGLLAGRPGRVAALFTRLLSASVLLVIGWQLWVKADRLASANDLTATLGIEKAPVAWFMAALCLAAGLLLLAELVLGRPDVPGSTPPSPD